MRFYRRLCALFYRKELAHGEPSYLVRFVGILGTILFIVLIAYFHDPVSQNRYSPIAKIFEQAPNLAAPAALPPASPEITFGGLFFDPANSLHPPANPTYLRCSLLLL